MDNIIVIVSVVLAVMVLLILYVLYSWWHDHSSADLQDVLTKTTEGSKMGQRAQQLVQADRPDWGEPTA